MKKIGSYVQGDECTFTSNQPEYHLLEELANKLMELSPNGFKYWIDDVYLDYGSRWMWTTVLAEDTISPYFQSTYQAISPAEWLSLMNGEDITYIAEHVLCDKYCPDRVVNRKSSVLESYSVPVPEKRLNFIKNVSPDTFKNIDSPEYVFEDEDEYIKDRFEYIKQKDVSVDGWRDTYIMYYDKYEDQFVFVFDESDLYDNYFDYTCEGEREADEWFDLYQYDEGSAIVSSKILKHTIRSSYNPYGTDVKWNAELVELYFDNDTHRFYKYTRNYKGNAIVVQPEYNERTDVFGWAVYLNGKRLELFETQYDALDFAQFELVDMYITPVRSSKKVSGKNVTCESDMTFETEEYEPAYQVSGYYDRRFYGLAEERGQPADDQQREAA